MLRRRSRQLGVSAPAFTYYQNRNAVDQYMVGFRWEPRKDITFRASYSTGVLAPILEVLPNDWRDRCQFGTRQFWSRSEARNTPVGTDASGNFTAPITVSVTGNPHLKRRGHSLFLRG